MRFIAGGFSPLQGPFSIASFQIGGEIKVEGIKIERKRDRAGRGEEMGGLDDNRKPSPSPFELRQRLQSKIKIVVLVLLTNLCTFYFFSGSINAGSHYSKLTHDQHHSEGHLIRELNGTQRRLVLTENHLSEVKIELRTAQNLLGSLLKELRKFHEIITQDTSNAKSDAAAVASQNREEEKDPTAGWGSDVSEEVKNVIAEHKLPFGFSSQFGSDEIFPPLGHACRRYSVELKQYMNYDVGGECPSDDVFAQQLMLKGCEPLPRRRCHPPSPKNYVQPRPFPESLWETPPDTSIIWHPYRCKNYKCLIERKNTDVQADCKDCFDLEGREKHRWLEDHGDLDYGIDEVLKLKNGSIRIGLDIGGGSGTFAARMRERAITIVTSSMNFDAPFNNFIASRGLVPIYVSVSQRLPFFDSTLDIIHSMHVLSNWIPDNMLEFTIYDIYRVLRPGGLFWLDHFFCLGHQLNETYVPMFDRVGFTKRRWTLGRKLDRGIERDEWYLSALFEKPMY